MTAGNFGPGEAKPVSAKIKHLSNENCMYPHIHHNCIDINTSGLYDLDFHFFVAVMLGPGLIGAKRHL